MGNNVFANGRELACKSGSGKVLAAFPDVCFTPPDKVPPTPPGVPIPYPVTSMASDTDKGTKKVMISNKEVMQRDSSNFKKCTGDEAAQTAKKGMINSKLSGKVFFTSWSMDIKIEGKNVVRHLDTTTSNHSSPNANAAVPMVFQDMMDSLPQECSDQKEKFENDCSNTTVVKVSSTKNNVNNCSDACKAAQKCILVPKDQDKKFCCGDNTDTDERTGDHLVEVNNFVQQGGRGGMPFTVGDLTSRGLTGLKDQLEGRMSKSIPLDSEMAGYDPNKAPTVCVGKDHANPNHRKLQKFRDQAKRRYMRMDGGVPLKAWSETEVSHWTYDEASSEGAAAHKKAFPQCDAACTKAQLDAYHTAPAPQGAGISPSQPVRTEVVLG